MKQSAEENLPIRWRKGNFIGTGAFGHVYLGMDLDSGELLAVKQVGMHASISKVGPFLPRELFKRYMDVVLFSRWLVMIARSNATREKAQVIRKYTEQLLHGLKYLQCNGIIQRDIKVYKRDNESTSPGCSRRWQLNWSLLGSCWRQMLLW